MFFIKYLLLFMVILHASSPLENEQNITKNQWSLLQKDTKANIQNIYDETLKKNVTKFQGQGTKSAYILKLKHLIHKKENIISWQMNYAEDFVIIINISTQRKDFFLIYTPNDDSSALQYGLGKDTTKGTWKEVSRNLQEDLNDVSSEKIISVNSFLIRGSGLMDEIRFKKNTKLFLQQEVVEESIKRNTLTKKMTSMPKLFIQGANPLRLNIGETYFEEGAIATDGNADELSVNISHQIDILRNGEYSVIYMASDSNGNSVVDRRRVIVGHIVIEKQIPISYGEELEEDLDKDQAEEYPLRPGL